MTEKPFANLVLCAALLASSSVLAQAEYCIRDVTKPLQRDCGAYAQPARRVPPAQGEVPPWYVPAAPAAAYPVPVYATPVVPAPVYAAPAYPVAVGPSGDAVAAAFALTLFSAVLMSAARPRLTVIHRR